ncbi:tctex1 domain-containing protein 1-like [Cimex lectularius]|uniref:Uncharacterized protein n=1 Tax=Cimex lectularius TaxID=79782 RepID=A0A8I6RGU5_CIMLE|nr:tctex1 domain-containing protein 1-like [Cimex lectularius]
MATCSLVSVMEKRRKPSLTQALAKQVLEQAHILEQLAKKKKEASEEIPIKKGYTFRLESRNPFRTQTVYKIMEEIILEGMDGFYYNPKEAAELCKKFSSEIRTKVKALNFERYKLICGVEIVQKNLQGIHSICSFLWDPERDNFSLYTFDKFDLFVAAYVFGVYHE